MYALPGFLPVSKQDLHRLGWEEPDFICVTGDAYVDHPSFGVAIISRLLASLGFKVGIIAQPAWQGPEAFRALGRPKYGFFVTAGNIDSMVAHYTAAKKPRSEDLYSPGGKPQKRPDRATIVYTGRIREAYPGCPVILGGLEASLRRFAHYDYWSDSVRRSVLCDSGADLIVYGMGEHQTEEIANRLAAGEAAASLTDIRGTCVLLPEGAAPPAGSVRCPSYERVRADKKTYAEACRIQYDNQDAVTGRAVVQPHGGRLLVQNPPAPPLTRDELDHVYALPFIRYYHPMYESQGGVPAIKEVEFSITHNRGCFGACNFCSISFHQGRVVSSRSIESVLAEAAAMVKSPRFKGNISDVGGPTANFRHPSCKKQLTEGVCRGRKCLAPTPCPSLDASHAEYLELLRALRALPGIKRVFVRSGLRFDYVMAEKNDTFLGELVRHHVSGQLRVAPEHCSAEVLDQMGKPHIEVYEAFSKKFYELTKKAGREQYIVPYLMSSHPGSTIKDAVALALFLKREHLHPEQVQDFYPTPGTVSTCMFYTGLDPYTMKPLHVPRDAREKAMQRALLQYSVPANRRLVLEALEAAGRRDLIGRSAHCLVPPDASTAPGPAHRAPRGNAAKPQRRNNPYEKKKK
ncbi:MAG: YgiQ family radical SAM protein [Clostridia bacterium]|nr:YgiQ family radical SAM protein [Clostridia bacterium]